MKYLHLNFAALLFLICFNVCAQTEKEITQYKLRENFDKESENEVKKFVPVLATLNEIRSSQFPGEKCEGLRSRLRLGRRRLRQRHQTFIRNHLVATTNCSSQ